MLVPAQLVPRFPVFNCLVPPEGSKGVPLLIDFSLASHFEIQGGLLTALGFLQLVQTIWIDTTGATAAVTVTIAGTGQRITVKANTQGFYPVFVPNRFVISFDSATATVVEIILLNMPISKQQIRSTGSPAPASDAMKFLLKQDAANSGSLDFKTVFSDNPTFDDFWIEFVDVVPSVNLDDLQIQFSTDGINPDGGAHYTQAAAVSDGTASTFYTAAGTTAVLVDCNNGISNNATKNGLVATVKVYKPADGTVNMRGSLTGGLTDSGLETFMSTFSYTNLAAVKGFFVSFSIGNIKTGSVRVYGLEKS